MAKKNNAFEKRLKKAQKNWEDAAKEKENLGGSTIDDGTYRTRLSEGNIADSSKQELLVILGFKITEGDFKGETAKRFYNLEGKNAAKSLAFLQFDLEKLGMESPDDLSDIPAILKKLLEEKPSVLVSLRTKGEYQNTNIIRLLDDEDTEDEDSDEDEDEDDDKKKKKKKESDNDDEDEEEDDEEEEEETEDEEDEDESEDDEDSDDEDDNNEDDEDEDEEDEEEDEKPKKKKKKVTEEDDEDEDEEEDDDDSDDEDDEEDEKEDKLEIEEGGKVSVPYKAGKAKATILKIFEKKEKVKVKLANGKTLTVSFSDLS